MLRATDNEVNQSNVGHLMNAAEMVETGKLPYNAMKENFLNPVQGDGAEIRRALQMLGAYKSEIIRSGDAEELMRLYGLEEESGKGNQSGELRAESGEQYSIGNTKNGEAHIKDQIRLNIRKLDNMEAVSNISAETNLDPYYKAGAKDYKSALAQWGIAFGEKIRSALKACGGV